ncbi:hypothetical protein V5O48_000772 [Marasmius crinis-equi]|uniref:DUF6534 domain-containing protein n=1 Tax=Marasmius crinis-equi TaxID=585013 RepID=A0ABR3G0C0_9AGAR
MSIAIADFSISFMERTMGAAYVGVVLAATLYGVYDYLIIHFGNSVQLSRTVWSLLLEVLVNGAIALLVQSFLTLRIWRLSNSNKLLTGVAYLLVLGEFGCITAFGIIGLLRVRTFDDLATLKGLSITVNVLAVASDLYIAVALCFLLHRSKTGYKKSDTMVWKLSTYALNTGLVTSICALASLISITAGPDTFVYILFFFSIGRLYANSLLANLNVRPYVRKIADNINYDSTLFNDIRFATTGGTERTLSRHAAGVSIQIDTIRMQHFEDEVGEGLKDGQDVKSLSERPTHNRSRSKSLSMHLSDVTEEDSSNKSAEESDIALQTPSDTSLPLYTAGAAV